MMLLITSFLGSAIGFFVCYQTVAKMRHVNIPVRMRVCMLNSMSLAFIFAMFTELTTGSKSLAVMIPVITVCLPMVYMMKPFNVLDVVESCIANLMSVSMSVMLIGMVEHMVIWVIQCFLVIMELVLCLSLQQKSHIQR